MSKGPAGRASWLGAYVLGCVVLLSSCGQPSADTQQLRISNVGALPIATLTVLFPDEQISFGDIPPGATSRYREVAGGVYRYAAYRLEIDGQLVTQPVIDWVGEQPMEGQAFTYSLQLDPNGSRFDIVHLVDVTRDN